MKESINYWISFAVESYGDFKYVRIALRKLEIEKVLESFETEDLNVLDDFMIDGLIVRNIHPRKLASEAYHHFKNSIYEFGDWGWVIQYYSQKLHSIKYLESIPRNGFVVGNSHHDACNECNNNISAKVYSVRKVYNLIPCCDFCRCLWLEFLPDKSYIKGGKVVFVLNNEMEDERVVWIKSNRHLFKRKYEIHQYVDESPEARKRVRKFRKLLLNDSKLLKYLFDNNRDTLKRYLNE